MSYKIGPKWYGAGGEGVGIHPPGDFSLTVPKRLALRSLKCFTLSFATLFGSDIIYYVIMAKLLVNSV